MESVASGLADAAVQPDLLEEGPAELLDAAEIDQRGLRGKCRLPMTIFSPDREVGEQVEFLIDDADAEALRVQRVGDCDGSRRRSEMVPPVGARGPGQDARQRALARAVLAHQGVHLARRAGRNSRL